MPQYMLLIYTPAEGGPTPDEAQAEMSRWFEYTESLREAGALVAGEALEPAGGARTVRLRGGARQVTEGPVAETPDVLGGFYIIEVADFAAAEDWAARIPSAPYGATEIRPVMVFAESAA
jgi:hypothetical protein